MENLLQHLGNTSKGLPAFRYINHSRHKGYFGKIENACESMTDTQITPWVDKRERWKKIYTYFAPVHSPSASDWIISCWYSPYIFFFFNLNDNTGWSKCALNFLLNCYLIFLLSLLYAHKFLIKIHAGIYGPQYTYHCSHKHSLSFIASHT